MSQDVEGRVYEVHRKLTDYAEEAGAIRTENQSLRHNDEVNNKEMREIMTRDATTRTVAIACFIGGLLAVVAAIGFLFMHIISSHQ